MSLYQKYRPKSFAETISQNHIIDILKSSLQRQNFGHAYLFVGTRGAGKTSLARIFSRALNCMDKDHLKKSGEPCNKCESCLLSLKASHPDIIEMDAASNRGIEEIRSLKESVDFVPSMGQYKVYIIDEVHMMTKEAFNALLKTLEEPPKHVVFIMCTTELFKIPATIISRSQVFELRFATVDEIVQKLESILKSEERKIDKEALQFIAKLGKGSFRDTESVLEKVLNSSKDDDLNFEEVTNILGFTQFALVGDVKDAIYSQNLQNLQTLLQENLDEGNVSNFNYQLTELVYEDIVAELKTSSSDKFKLSLFDFLTSLDKDLKNTLSPKILFIAKILNFIGGFSLENVIVQPKVQKVEVKAEKQEEKLPTVDDSKTKFNPAAAFRKAKAKETSQKVEEKSEETPEIKKSAVRVSKIDFLDFVKTKNAFLYRFLIHKEFEISDNKIIVEAERKMEKDMLSKPAIKEIIRQFGENIGTDVILEIGTPKVDHRTIEEKEIEKVSKKVEDLTDAEIKDIFNLK